MIARVLSIIRSFFSSHTHTTPPQRAPSCISVHVAFTLLTAIASCVLGASCAKQVQVRARDVEAGEDREEQRRKHKEEREPHEQEEEQSLREGVKESERKQKSGLPKGGFSYRK